MVTISRQLATFALPVVWAQAGAQKLPPPTRAAVIMALLGIVLVGLLIVAIILLGGHWVRRQGVHRRGRSVPPDRQPLHRQKDLFENSPANASLNPPKASSDAVSDQSNSGETLA